MSFTGRCDAGLTPSSSAKPARSARVWEASVGEKRNKSASDIRHSVSREGSCTGRRLYEGSDTLASSMHYTSCAFVGLNARVLS